MSVPSRCPTFLAALQEVNHAGCNRTGTEELPGLEVLVMRQLTLSDPPAPPPPGPHPPGPDPDEPVPIEEPPPTIPIPPDPPPAPVHVGA